MSKPKKYDDPALLSKAVSEILTSYAPVGGKPNRAEVAEASGVSTGQLSELLNGQKVFTISELDRICFALKLKTSAIVRQAEVAQRNRYLGTPVQALDVKRQERRL